MPFDDRKYDQAAIQGDVGYTAYMAHHALRSLMNAIEKIAAKAEVDISDELSHVREDVDVLKDEFDRLTGWKPE